MATNDTVEGYFSINTIIPGNVNVKSHNIRIGSATLLTNGVMLCTIDAIPLNWDGKFSIRPSKSQGEFKMVDDVK